MREFKHNSEIKHLIGTSYLINSNYLKLNGSTMIDGVFYLKFYYNFTEYLISAKDAVRFGLQHNDEPIISGFLREARELYQMYYTELLQKYKRNSARGSKIWCSYTYIKMLKVNFPATFNKFKGSDGDSDVCYFLKSVESATAQDYIRLINYLSKNEKEMEIHEST